MEAEEKIIANGLDQSNEDSYNENGEFEDENFEIDNEAVKAKKIK